MADLTNTEIKNILLSYGKECGPITPQTKNIYLKQIEKLQKSYTNKIPTKPMKRFEPLDTYRLHFRSSTASSDNGMDIISNNSRRREMKSSNISPNIYLSNNNTKTYREPLVVLSPQENESNVGERWYKGSLRALSSCLGTKDSGLMDISDADISDTEGNLFTRLRKNYFKKPDFQDFSTPVQSSCPSNQIHNTESSYDFTNLPNILLAISIVLILVLFGTYLAVKNRYSNFELDIAMERLLCKPLQENHCFTETEVKSLKPYLYRLYEVTSKFSGQKLCEGKNDRRMSFQTAKEYVNHNLKKDGLMTISDQDWSRLMMLVISLPSALLNIIGYDNENIILDDSRWPEDVTFLECLKPRINLSCQIKLKAILLFNWLSYILLSALMFVAVLLFFYGLYLYRRRQKEANNRRINKLKEVLSSIKDILQEQLHRSESNSLIEAFLPLEKIRIMLQQTYPELRDNKQWEMVKDYTFRNEPCIQMRETLVNGTTLLWRGRPGWQGSGENFISSPAPALAGNHYLRNIVSQPVHSGKEVYFERGPTECLKIRNLIVDKFNCNWEEYLRRELTSRLQEMGDILHIGFTKKDTKIMGYVMCGSREVAGKAFNKINANYFNGNLLKIKFIRVEKYLQRFPGARDLVK